MPFLACNVSMQENQKKLFRHFLLMQQIILSLIQLCVLVRMIVCWLSCRQWLFRLSVLNLCWQFFPHMLTSPNLFLLLLTKFHRILLPVYIVVVRCWKRQLILICICVDQVCPAFLLSSLSALQPYLVEKSWQRVRLWLVSHLALGWNFFCIL